MHRLIFGRTAVCVGTLVFLTTGLAGSPQQQPSSAAAGPESHLDAGLVAADRLFKEHRWDEAQTAYESTLKAAKQSGDVGVEESVLIALSNLFIGKSLYPQARDYGLRGLDLAERAGHQGSVGQANLLLATTADFMGDRAEAKTRAARAIAAFEAVNDPLGRARATLALVRTGNVPDARRLVERAIADAHAGGDFNLEASAYHSIGDGYFAESDYESALSAYEHAAALYTESHATNELGAVYNSVGRLYRAHGQLQAALEYQLKALELHERGSLPFYKMQSLNAVSAVYQMLGENDQARTYIERALKVAEQSGSPRIQDFLRANLANILSSQGEFGRAVELFESVIAHGADTYITGRYTQLSYALRKLGRHEEAFRAASTAVNRCLEKAGDVKDDSECPWAFRARAEANQSRGDVTAALGDITAALNRIEDARARLVPSDFFKQDFVRSQEATYSLAIGLQLQQGHGEEALETAELARSRAFIDLLASRDVRLKPADSPSEPHLTFRGNVLPVAPRELSSLAIAPPSRAADLVATARRLKSTLLMYWVAQDQLFIWVVAPDGRIRTARVEVLESKLRALGRATIPFDDTQIAGAAKSVATRGGDQFPLDVLQRNAWRDLYDLLIRPVRSALPAVPGSLLTIVPHGPLAGLPFAALQNERGRYLLEDFTLHYAPAGAVLQFTAGKRHMDARSGAVLIVADPVVSTAARLGRPLPSLPGARVEAREISRQLAGGRLTLLTGADATEARVSAAAERKAVVHFATHAIVREDSPFESFLALAPNGATENGLMTAEDVYRLNLDADLVVLSACRSGGGRVSGDGIAAFARAFIYAGTPSVVVSQWDVADHATSTLIASFYRAWLAGASKGRALRAAQLQMLRNLRAGRITVTTAAGPIVLPEHPIFWAGFSLIGEPE